MTIPAERLRSLKITKDFLEMLLDPKRSPRVPKDIRLNAYWCLRHYPHDYEIERLPKLDPKTWGDE